MNLTYCELNVRLVECESKKLTHYRGNQMSRTKTRERKAFVVISRNQTKIWDDLSNERAIPKTVYERNSIPKSFMQREFSPREIQRNFFARLTNRLDSKYAHRIASRLEGIDQVFVVGAGSRRLGLVNDFTRLAHRAGVLQNSRIHAVKNIDPERMNERELLAIARKMGSQFI